MHNILQQALFYTFATLTVIAALLVVTRKNPIHSVLWLVFAFFTSSVLWILLEAEFLALILVLVYVGAVMTLFLFVIMMLNIDQETLAAHKRRLLPLGLMILAGFVALFISALPATPGIISEALVVPSTLPNTQALGQVLYTDYFVAFELAAVLLLVAIIASITLVHRAPRSSKRQNTVAQIMTRRDERVTLIRMPAEK
jgi:NADH-quinone oxidoreductase subunit J